MAAIEPKTVPDRTGQQFTIRTAQPGDADKMLAYVRAVVEETDFFVIEPDELPPSVEEERTWIQGHLDHPGKLLLLAEAAGCIVGNVRIESGPYRRIAHKGNLSMAVVREWRSRGVGTALLRAALDGAKSSPLVVHCCLAFFAHNSAAIRVYEKLGFTEEGRRIKEVKRGPDDYVDMVTMCKFV